MKTRYHIFAQIISKKKTVLAACTNSYTKSHPLQKYFAEKVGKPHNIYLHAEIKAMIMASIQQHGDLHTLRVSRYGKGGKLLDAKPCIICIEAAIFFGIKRINYTTKDGWVYGKTPQELKKEYYDAANKPS